MQTQAGKDRDMQTFKAGSETDLYCHNTGKLADIQKHRVLEARRHTGKPSQRVRKTGRKTDRQTGRQRQS